MRTTVSLFTKIIQKADSVDDALRMHDVREGGIPSTSVKEMSSKRKTGFFGEFCTSIVAFCNNQSCSVCNLLFSHKYYCPRHEMKTRILHLQGARVPCKLHRRSVPT